MEAIIYICVGIVVGFVLQRIVFYMRSVGTLRVDNSDPDDVAYLFLELSKDIGFIKKKKYIVLKVNLKSYISQE